MPTEPVGHRIGAGLRVACLATALVLTALLFHLGAQPFAAGLFREPWDKIAHLSVFALLSGLLWLATGGRRHVLPVGIVATIGALDEWRQRYLPGRSTDLGDLATDVIGATLAVILLRIVWKPA